MQKGIDVLVSIAASIYSSVGKQSGESDQTFHHKSLHLADKSILENELSYFKRLRTWKTGHAQRGAADHQILRTL